MTKQDKVAQYRQLDREIEETEKRLEMLNAKLETLSASMEFLNYVEGFGSHGMPKGILFVGTLEECQTWAETNYSNLRILDKDPRFFEAGRQIGLPSHQALAGRIWTLYPTSKEWDKVMAMVGDKP